MDLDTLTDGFLVSGVSAHITGEFYVLLVAFAFDSHILMHILKYRNRRAVKKLLNCTQRKCLLLVFFCL